MTKKVYKTPTLKNLGSIEDVTLGRRSGRRRRRSRRGIRRRWWNTGS